MVWLRGGVVGEKTKTYPKIVMVEGVCRVQLISTAQLGNEQINKPVVPGFYSRSVASEDQVQPCKVRTNSRQRNLLLLLTF